MHQKRSVFNLLRIKKYNIQCEIGHSHSGEDVCAVLLDLATCALTGRYQCFGKHAVYILVLKMETDTQHHNPGEQYQHNTLVYYIYFRYIKPIILTHGTLNTFLFKEVIE
jgi:hypothetical protein